MGGFLSHRNAKVIKTSHRARGRRGRADLLLHAMSRLFGEIPSERFCRADVHLGVNRIGIENLKDPKFAGFSRWFLQKHQIELSEYSLVMFFIYTTKFYIFLMNFEHEKIFLCKSLFQSNIFFSFQRGRAGFEFHLLIEKHERTQSQAALERLLHSPSITNTHTR